MENPDNLCQDDFPVRCVTAAGLPCLHEAFLFAVGETAEGAVELDVYLPDGRLWSIESLLRP